MTVSPTPTVSERETVVVRVSSTRPSAMRCARMTSLRVSTSSLREAMISDLRPASRSAR